MLTYVENINTELLPNLITIIKIWFYRPKADIRCVRNVYENLLLKFHFLKDSLLKFIGHLHLAIGCQLFDGRNRIVIIELYYIMNNLMFTFLP